MASGGHISRSISQEPEVPTEDSNAESNKKATMKELDLLIDLKLFKPSKWNVLGSVISAEDILLDYHHVRNLFGAKQFLSAVYPLLYDITYDDVKDRLWAFRDIPFEDISSKMHEMERQNDDDILRAIFDMCDSFKTFWRLMHLPHLDYEKRCKIFNLAEHNTLQEEMKDAIKTFHKQILVKKDDDDLFDALLVRKDLFNIGKKLVLFRERIKYLKYLKVSNALFKATPHVFSTCKQLDKLIETNEQIEFSTSLTTDEGLYYNFFGACVESKLSGASGTCGFVFKDRISGCRYLSTVGHVLLGKEKKWWLEFIHSSECMTNTKHAACGVQGTVKNEDFEALVFYNEGDEETSGHETALLKLPNKSASSRPRNIYNGQEPLLTFEFCGITGLPKPKSIVYKYGKTTCLTRGTVDSIQRICKDDSNEMILYKQIVVKWDEEKRFSDAGDSGAPVYCIEDKELFLVGTLEGSDYMGSKSYVSPIPLSTDYSLEQFNAEVYEVIPKPNLLQYVKNLFLGRTV